MDASLQKRAEQLATEEREYAKALEPGKGQG